MAKKHKKYTKYKEYGRQTSLAVNLYGAGIDGDNRHAQEIIKSLGISYIEAIPQSIVDSWWFYGCQNIPKKLPRYIHHILLVPDYLTEEQYKKCVEIENAEFSNANSR